MLNVKYYCLRTLLFGVCRIISSSTGPVDGMLGGRFIHLFFTCLSFLLYKGLLFTFAMTSSIIKIGSQYGLSIFRSIGVMTYLFIPQMLLSIFSTIGFSKNSFKLIFQHPELLLISSGWYEYMYFNSVRVFSSDKSPRSPNYYIYCSLLLSQW